MKDLKTHLLETIKPPRLSAKNKELWKNGLVDEEKIMEWLKKNCGIYGRAKIVDGKINVEGDIYIANKSIEYFPYPFGEVAGYFSCNGCKKLKSLKNSPQRVGNYFSCSECDSLTSLEGAPEEVGSDFYCYLCPNLTSLEGAPKYVGDCFNCCDCGKKFTRTDVRKICKVMGNVLI